MKVSGIITAAVLAGLLTCCSAKAAEKVKALMLTQSAGFKHGSVNRKGTLAPAEVAMTQLGQQTGLFDLVCTQDAAVDFTKDNLAKYDLVMFYTTGDSKTGELPVAKSDIEYFLNDWVKKKGHGFVGFHSATDTYKDYQPYWDFVGGTFNGHPWGAGETVTITVHDTKHPAMKPFGSEFEIKDEIYWYSHWQPEKVHVLMSLNIAKCKTKGAKAKIKECDKEVEVIDARHVPVSWVKNVGDGRMFYTNLGHNEGTWVDKRFLDHATGGIKWALGQEEGDDTQNPQLSAEQEAKAKQDAKMAP